jgi:hypothetical protein
MHVELHGTPEGGHLATLSGTYLDLITDGVPQPITRQAVVMAVRRIMLSAHRHELPYHHIQVLLTDTNRRLPVQIATGRGKRLMNVHQVSSFLKKLWAQTEKLAAERPAWSREDALHAIEFVRDNWLGMESLPQRKQDILDVVLDLATEYGTTRPAVPVREVAKRTGYPFQTVSRLLRQLAADGEWLSLAQQGNYRTRRASLYTIAPPLLRHFNENIWGASPPVSQPPSMSHPSMSQGSDSMNMSITVSGSTAEDLRQAIRVLMNANPNEAKELLQDSDLQRLRLLVSG